MDFGEHKRCSKNFFAASTSSPFRACARRGACEIIFRAEARGGGADVVPSTVTRADPVLRKVALHRGETGRLALGRDSNPRPSSLAFPATVGVK